MKEIAYSILSSDFSKLEDDLNIMLNSGVKYLHYDVMDGHFVNNISFGPHVLSTINKEHKLINDVHLMITNPRDYVEKFVLANADIITFHYEALKNDDDIDEIINLIHTYNCKCGLSIKPKTSVDKIVKFLNKLDLVLIMSVEPGFGGQSFIEETYKKIEVLDGFKKKYGLNFIIEVDGGVNNTNGKKILKSGANLLVCGSYLAKADHKKEAILSILGD